MTAMQMNAEIFQHLGYLADDESYMSKVLAFLKKLSSQKKSAAARTTNTTKKIVVDMNRPLPTDKYVGLASSNREDDEKAREEFMRGKYGMYL